MGLCRRDRGVNLEAPGRASRLRLAFQRKGVCPTYPKPPSRLPPLRLAFQRKGLYPQQFSAGPGADGTEVLTSKPPGRGAGAGADGAEVLTSKPPGRGAVAVTCAPGLHSAGPGRGAVAGGILLSLAHAGGILLSLAHPSEGPNRRLATSIGHRRRRRQGPLLVVGCLLRKHRFFFIR